MNDLQKLYTAHLQTIPFENIDEHDHSRENDEIPLIPRRKDLPSLDVKRSLTKFYITKEVDFASNSIFHLFGYYIMKYGIFCPT